MRTLCAISALLALLALSSTFCSAASSSSSSPGVVSLSSADFRQQIVPPLGVTLVNFCTARNGKCRELAPQYASLSKVLAAGSVLTATVDCKASADVCEEQHVPEGGAPLIRLFSPALAKPATYKGKELKAKEIAEWVWGAYPNSVVSLTVASEKSSPRDSSKARVLLFTDKRETSPLYKSIALALSAQRDAVVVAEVRKGEKGLLSKYGIGKSFPVLLVEPPVAQGEEPKSARRYDGKMEKQLILEFVQSFLPATGAAGAAAGASAAASGADAAAAAASVPELVDQSCVEKYCGSNLCIVMVQAGDAPDHASALAQLALIDKAARSDKSLGSFRFAWVDHAKHAEWVQSNFYLQMQAYPQLVLLSVRKGRQASFVGSFSHEGVVEFLRDISRGRTKTMPFTTRDGKFVALPEGNSCPPEVQKQEEAKSARAEKASASSSAGAADAQPVQEEDELHELTSATHDSLLLPSSRPWVLLFHSGDAHSASSHQVLSAEFARVAKNMKNMVQFGRIDVAAQPDLARHWGVSAEQVPLVKAVPHGKKSKVQPEESKDFPPAELATADAKSLRTFAQSLLTPANVLLVDAQNGMQNFMGAGPMEPNTPFSPKLILFLKPSADGSVVIPDMLKSLALEFGGTGAMTFGVASSKEKSLAQQFQVRKIPAVFTMAQAADAPGVEANQMAVSASPYEGKIDYPHLHAYCAKTMREYTAQKRAWKARAAQQGAAGGASAGGKGKDRRYQPPPQHVDEDEHVDLDKDEL